MQVKRAYSVKNGKAYSAAGWAALAALGVALPFIRSPGPFEAYYPYGMKAFFSASWLGDSRLRASPVLIADELGHLVQKPLEVQEAENQRDSLRPLPKSALVVIPELDGKGVLTVNQYGGGLRRIRFDEGDAPLPSDIKAVWMGGAEWPDGGVIISSGAKGAETFSRLYALPSRSALKPRAESGSLWAAEAAAAQLQDKQGNTPQEKSSYLQPDQEKQQQQQQQQNPQSLPLDPNEAARLTIPLAEGRQAVLSGKREGGITFTDEAGKVQTLGGSEGYVLLAAVHDEKAEKFYLSVRRIQKGDVAPPVMAYWERGTQGMEILSEKKLPPPLAILVLAGGLSGLLTLYRRRKEAPARDVTGAGQSDRPLTEDDHDVAGAKILAGAISRFIRNSETAPPLTIAVTGPWGSGKSSVMQLTEQDLRRHGVRAVRFNVWYHQNEEDLLQALLANIREQATPPVCSAAGLLYRGRLFWARYREWLWLPVGFFMLWAAARWALPLFGVSAVKVAEVIGPFIDKLAEWLNGKKPEDNEDATVKALTAAPFFTALFPLVKALRPMAPVLVNQLKKKEAGLSFRYRFARDFDRICTAMRRQYGGGLVVIMDDLDRCTPEVTAAMTESINFLAESGRCFVLMGYDPKRVTAAVNRAHDKDENDRFGEEYLRKIVNLPLAVPHFEAQHAAHLAQTRAAAASLPPAPEYNESAGSVVIRARRVMAAVYARLAHPETRRAVIRFGDVVLGLAAIVLTVTAVTFGVWRLPKEVRYWMTGQEISAVASEKKEPAESSASPEALRSAASLPANEPPGQPFVLPPAPVVPQDVPKLVFPEGGMIAVDVLWLSVLTLAVIAAVLSAYSALSKRVNEGEIHEESDFCKALAALAGVAFALDATPRGVKRFNNYVRFGYSRYKSLPPVQTEGGPGPARCAVIAALSMALPREYWPQEGESVAQYAERLAAMTTSPEDASHTLTQNELLSFIRRHQNDVPTYEDFQLFLTAEGGQAEEGTQRPR